jgi:dihydrodipicolinate synthase/N-acetylneuraminate lyase
MHMDKNWSGVFPAATTEFARDGSLSLDATVRHLEILIAAGIHGVVMLGTVGENTSLEHEEKLDVLRAALDTCAGRIPMLTGVADYTTAKACHFARDAERLGVDGLMVLPAMVYKSDPRETMAHFRSVASSTGLPVMCYNNPVAYGVDITPEMFAAMADEPNLAAIKESSEDVRRITDLRNVTGDRYILFEGVDDLALEGIMLGATGWVSGLVNAFPRETVALWNLARAGRYAEAVHLYRWFTPLLHLDTKPKLVQYIKLADALAGTGAEYVRAPRLLLEGAERDETVRLIQRAIDTRPVLPDHAMAGVRG